MSNTKEISYEVVLEIYKQDFVKREDALIIIPASKYKLTRPRKDKIQYMVPFLQSHIRRDEQIENPEIEFITVRNTGFELEIVPFQYCSRIYHSSTMHIPVYINHPDLNNLGYRLIMPVQLDSYLSIINQSGCNIMNGKIAGTFCMNGTGIISELVPEDRDKQLQEGIERGELLATKGKTKKWIPGHKYLLENQTTIIYFGDCITAGRNYYPSNLFENYTSYNGYFNFNSALVSPLVLELNRYVEENNKPILDNYSEGIDIATFLHKYIIFELSERSKQQYYRKPGLKTYRTVRYAVDLGEFLAPMDEGVKISNVILETCRQFGNNLAVLPFIIPMAKQLIKEGEAGVKESVIEMFAGLMKNALSRALGRDYKTAKIEYIVGKRNYYVDSVITLVRPIFTDNDETLCKIIKRAQEI